MAFCPMCKKQKPGLTWCDFCGSLGCSDCIDATVGLCKKCKKA